MAVRLTVTKNIEKAVAEAVAHIDAPPWVKDLHDRIQAARNKPARTGLGWEGFVELAGNVLGDRLALPELLTPAWKSKINNMLAASGLTVDGAVRAAALAGRVFRGSISAEYLITRASGLLADDARKQVEHAESGGLDEFNG